MFRYRNRKGQIVSSPCRLSGGGWEPLEEKKPEKVTRTRKAKAEKTEGEKRK